MGGHRAEDGQNGYGGIERRTDRTAMGGHRAEDGQNGYGRA